MLQLISSSSTDRVPQKRACAYFSEALSKLPFPWKVKPHSEELFHGWSSKYQFGPLFLHYGGLSPCELKRNPSKLPSGDERHCTLLFVRKGGVELLAYDRSVSITEGACAFLEEEFDYELRNDSDLEGMVIHLDKSFVRDWVASSSEAGFSVFSGESGWGRALQAYLYALSIKELARLPLPPDVIANQLGGMLALACDGRSDIKASTHTRALLRRIREVIREHYRDAELSPAVVAADIGISRRYLHALFATAGSTFGAELMDMRLDAARSLLLNRHHAGKTVAEIAFQSGFKNPSHFTRLFRQHFGTVPRTYRERG